MIGRANAVTAGAAAQRSRWVAHVVNTVATDPLTVISSYLSAYRARGWACWPSQETIARDTGCSVRTVVRVVARLEAAGLVVVDRHPAHHDPATGRWRRTTNRYRLRFKKWKRRPTRPDNRSSPTCHDRHDNDSFRESRQPEAVTAALGSAPPGRYDCPVCGQPVDIPGKWRHPWCTDGRKAPRPVELP